MRSNRADVSLLHRGVGIGRVEQRGEVASVPASRLNIERAPRDGQIIAGWSTRVPDRDGRRPTAWHRAAPRPRAAGPKSGRASDSRDRGRAGRGIRHWPAWYTADSMIRRWSFFERPAIRDEPSRQPIEQRGMSRRFRPQTEVAGRAHQSVTEMPLPDAIDDHARGERVLFRRDPTRQLAPAAPAGDRAAEIHPPRTGAAGEQPPRPACV